MSSPYGIIKKVIGSAKKSARKRNETPDHVPFVPYNRKSRHLNKFNDRFFEVDRIYGTSKDSKRIV